MRRPFVSKSRQIGMSAAEGRRWWLVLLGQAAELGELVAEGGELSRDQRFLFAGLVVRTDARPFPLAFESARRAADGFVLLARGFNTAEDPNVKAALGRALQAAAACCLSLLDIDARREAAVARRRLGEAD
jgi:hypothetical protein